MKGKSVHQANCERAADFFKFGHSTFRIANIMKMTEPKIVRLLDAERSKRLGLLSVQYEKPHGT